MLILENISKQYGGRTLFKDVNLSFKKGECYGIIGANGAGKSTLLKIISGEIESTDGHIYLDEKERMSVLKQDHDAFDEEEVLRTVLLGHKRLVDIMDQKEKLYSKEDFSEDDGLLVADLENEFLEMNGWEAESNAEKQFQSFTSCDKVPRNWKKYKINGIMRII